MKYFLHCSSLRTEFLKTMLMATYMKVRQISLDTPPAWGSDAAGDNTEGSLDDENVHCINVCSIVTEYYRGPHCWYTRVMSIEVLGTLRVSLAIPWCPVYPVLSWYRPWSPPRSALQWYCVCVSVDTGPCHLSCLVTSATGAHHQDMGVHPMGVISHIILWLLIKVLLLFKWGHWTLKLAALTPHDPTHIIYTYHTCCKTLIKIYLSFIKYCFLFFLSACCLLRHDILYQQLPLESKFEG